MILRQKQQQKYQQMLTPADDKQNRKHVILHHKQSFQKGQFNALQVGNYIYQRKKPFRKKINRGNQSFAFQVLAGQKLLLDTQNMNKQSKILPKKNMLRQVLPEQSQNIIRLKRQAFLLEYSHNFSLGKYASNPQQSSIQALSNIDYNSRNNSKNFKTNFNIESITDNYNNRYQYRNKKARNVVKSQNFREFSQEKYRYY